MTNQAGSPDPRRGVLARMTGGIYLVLVVELCFLLAAAPGLVGLLLVARDVSNLPLFMLCLLPMAPAFSAALYATRRAHDEGDLVIWPRFWRGWLANVREVLGVWIPALVVATMLTYPIAFGAQVGLDGSFIVAAWVLLAVVGLWTLNAVVIASLFSFRVRDIARLAVYHLVARPRVTLGGLALLVAAAGLVFLIADWVLAVLASLFAVAVLLTHRALIANVEERFTGPA